MSEPKMNQLEQELTALIKPFTPSGDPDRELRKEAHVLLSFVDSIISSGQGEGIISRQP